MHVVWIYGGSDRRNTIGLAKLLAQINALSHRCLLKELTEIGTEIFVHF